LHSAKLQNKIILYVNTAWVSSVFANMHNGAFGRADDLPFLCFLTMWNWTRIK